MKELRLPKAFADKWIAALESGDYMQGRSMLILGPNSDEPSYCCLGVAARIAGATDDELIGRFSIGCDIAKKYDIPHELINSDLEGTCMNLNDSQGKSFAEIAQFLKTIDLYE